MVGLLSKCPVETALPSKYLFSFHWVYKYRIRNRFKYQSDDQTSRLVHTPRQQQSSPGGGRAPSGGWPARWRGWQAGGFSDAPRTPSLPGDPAPAPLLWRHLVLFCSKLLRQFYAILLHYSRCNLLRFPASDTFLDHKGFCRFPVSRHFPYSVTHFRCPHQTLFWTTRDFVVSPVSRHFACFKVSRNRKTTKSIEKVTILRDFVLSPVSRHFPPSWAPQARSEACVNVFERRSQLSPPARA